MPSLQVSPGTFPNEKVARERSLKFVSLTWPTTKTHVALKTPLALKLSTGISFEISGKQPRQKKKLVVKPIENPSSEEKVNVHLVLCLMQVFSHWQTTVSGDSGGIQGLA